MQGLHNTLIRYLRDVKPNTNVHIFTESTIPGGPGVDYPTFSVPPPTSFSCQGLVQGYYADQVRLVKKGLMPVNIIDKKW